MKHMGGGFSDIPELLNGPCHKILNPRCWSNNSIPGPLIIWRNSVTVLHTYQAPLFIQNANPQQKRKQVTIYATDKIAILLKKGLIDSNDYTVSKLKKEVNCQIHVFFYVVKNNCLKRKCFVAREIWLAKIIVNT